jgi:hypothetical protein
VRIISVNGKPRHLGGRRRPSENVRTHPHLFKSMRSLLKDGGLPPPPAAFDFTQKASAALSDILGNSEVGDCTAAGPGHIIDSVTANAGSPVIITADQAIEFYSLSTGYVLGNPATDQGGDEVTVLTTWVQKGYDGKGAHAIKGFLTIDPSDQELIKTACYHFGNLYFGADLAPNWTQVSGDGFVWDVGQAPDPKEGHCFVGLGVNAQGVIVDSWGLIGTITWAAIAQFCSEQSGGNLFTVLTPEAVNRVNGVAPDGLDWAALISAFDAMGGNVPAAVRPVVPPQPPPSPSLIQELEAWLESLKRLAAGS